MGKTKIKFEKLLEQLEEIVRQLEEGELSLEESMEKYQSGVKIYRRCRELLDTAEKKIEILLKNEADELEAKPFRPEEGKPGENAEGSP